MLLKRIDFNICRSKANANPPLPKAKLPRSNKDHKNPPIYKRQKNCNSEKFSLEKKKLCKIFAKQNTRVQSRKADWGRLKRKG